MKLRVFRFFYLAVFIIFASNLRAQQQTSEAAPPSPEASRSDLPRWIKFSGELRSRVEGVTGGVFSPNSDDVYLLTRIRVAVKVEATPWLKFLVQGQDAHVFWKNQNPPEPPYQDTFDLRQGYIEVGDTDKMTYGLRIGRQELAYGDERLIGNSNWTNVARSFDGVRGTYRHDGLRLDVFAASVVKPRDLQFDKHVPGANIYGLYGGFDKLAPESDVEPYFFWRRSSGMTTEAGVPGILNFGTLGLRWAGKLSDGFDYATEMARQFGSLGTDTVSAWAGHWVVGYKVNRARFTPRFFTEFNYASGDDNPRDGQRGTFDQLYATAHDKYGMADQVGWKNIEHLRGAVEFDLKSNWQVSLKQNAWWLADPHDALYNSSSNVVARVANGSAGRFVGQETDLQTSYTFPHDIHAGGGYGHIFPGTFILRATPGVSYNFPYSMIDFTF
jgi:Alginate export